MAQITNNGNATPIGLPPDKLLEPGETKEIANWGDIKDLTVIAHYVAEGVLTVGDSVAAPAQQAEGDADSDTVPDNTADSTPPTTVRNVPNVPRPGGRR